MSDVLQFITDRDLEAYVDGEVTAYRKAAIEALIAADPRAARKVAALRAMNEALLAARERIVQRLDAEPADSQEKKPAPERGSATRR